MDHRWAERPKSPPAFSKASPIPDYQRSSKPLTAIAAASGPRKSLRVRSRKQNQLQRARMEQKQKSGSTAPGGGTVAPSPLRRSRRASLISRKGVTDDRKVSVKKEALGLRPTEERITGVCFDKGRKVWLGHWHENNKPFRKSFSVAKHGYEGARRKAIQWRRDRENGIPYERPKGACGKYKGVCYNEAQRGWRASWCKDGKEHCKYFSVAKHGQEGARMKAIQWRRDRESGIPIQKPARRTCDEVKGVCYDTLGKRWQASWSQGGRRISKRFPIAEYGSDEAKQMAIRWRKSREAETQLQIGVRVEVYWSKHLNKMAGLNRPASWCPARIDALHDKTIQVSYEEHAGLESCGGEGLHSLLQLDDFGMPPKGNDLVFRLIGTAGRAKRSNLSLSTPRNGTKQRANGPRKINLESSPTASLGAKLGFGMGFSEGISASTCKRRTLKKPSIHRATSLPSLSSIHSNHGLPTNFTFGDPSTTPLAAVQRRVKRKARALLPHSPILDDLVDDVDEVDSSRATESVCSSPGKRPRLDDRRELAKEEDLRQAANILNLLMAGKS